MSKLDKPLNILQVNTLDQGGGAEQIAKNLLQAYQSAGHQAWLAVGQKRSQDGAVMQIPILSDDSLWAQACLKLRTLLSPLHDKVRGIARLRKNLLDLSIGADVLPRWLGMEEFHYPGSKALLSLPGKKINIVQLHNLHGHYFDLRTVSEFSQKVPVVITMHDAWLLSGNCAHSFACDKWKTGCGTCPDIHIYPGLSRDTTALNWRRKKGIFAHSKIYLASPSQWLLDKAMQSLLASAIIEARVIPNGVDLTIFKPSSQASARQQLDIPLDAKVILFAANGIKRNRFKDYATIQSAIEILSKSATTPIVVLALGEEGQVEQLGNIQIRYIPPVSNREQVAAFYQSADVYVHASHADTFPTSIIEAMACGIPVVATAVGGIPEQVIDGQTGILVAPSDSAAMASTIEKILANPALQKQMGDAGAQIAKEQYSQELQAKRYLDWYQEMTSAPKDPA